MELTLGTAQLCMSYGINGSMNRMGNRFGVKILARAWELGIRALDTAQAYGDAEGLVAAACDLTPFRVNSKIAGIPGSLIGRERVEYVVAAAKRSKKLLGVGLTSILLHDEEDLQSVDANEIWAALHAWGMDNNVDVGLSCYDPSSARQLAQRYGVQIVQLPGSAIDQRIQRTFHDSAPFTVQVRSVLLQGLLLKNPEQAAKNVPASRDAISRWLQWCAERQLEPLEAAFSLVKGFDCVDACVIGVESVAQLEEVVLAWRNACPLHAPQLHVDDLNVVDPRRWDAVPYPPAAIDVDGVRPVYAAVASSLKS